MALTIQKDSQMTEMVVSKNIGSVVTVKNGSTSTSVTSGGAGNNTTKTGISIDRYGFGVVGFGGLPLSMVASCLFDATLASGSHMQVSIVVSHAPDNSTFTTYVSESALVTIGTGPSGGGAVSGSHSLNVDLSSAQRYIRVDHIPNLDRGGTDTALTRTVATLAGFDRLASPASV